MIWRVGRGVGVRRGGANNVRVDALEIPRPYYAPNPQSSTLSPEPFVHYHSCFHQVYAKLIVSCVLITIPAVSEYQVHAKPVVSCVVVVRRCPEEYPDALDLYVLYSSPSLRPKP